MKQWLILMICLTMVVETKSQPRKGLPTFAIHGQIVGPFRPEVKEENNWVRIDFTDRLNLSHSDTTYFDDEGNFYLESYQITEPVRFNLSFSFDDFPNLLAAPGYNLTFLKLTRNQHSYQLTGNGSKASKYYRLLDSIQGGKLYSIAGWTMKEADFLAQVNRTLKIRDSVAQLVFDAAVASDATFGFFKQMVQFDNQFEKLSTLLQYATQNNYSFTRCNDFINQQFGRKFFENIGNEDQLISQEFRNGISSDSPHSFLDFLLLSANPADSMLGMRNLPQTYRLEKANALFHGDVRAYVLYRIMAPSIWSYRSISAIKQYKERIKPWIPSLTANALQALNDAIGEKIKRLAVSERDTSSQELDVARSFEGKMAPPFKLDNSDEKVVRLQDFKGKVVVLNLWSSWSDLCRTENAKWNQIVKKFRKEKRVTFVGIAVFDTFEDWKTTLKTDKLKGIQLFDKEGKVFDDYIDERIPKYVIIDATGQIVNWMAPRPDQEDELIRVIKQALAKKEETQPVNETSELQTLTH